MDTSIWSSTKVSPFLKDACLHPSSCFYLLFSFCDCISASFPSVSEHSMSFYGDLDSYHVAGVDFLTFLMSLPKLLGGEGILDSNSISLEKVKTCDIQVEEKDKGKVNMELDGESIAVLPAQFHILPERMHMIM